MEKIFYSSTDIARPGNIEPLAASLKLTDQHLAKLTISYSVTSLATSPEAPIEPVEKESIEPEIDDAVNKIFYKKILQ